MVCGSEIKSLCNTYGSLSLIHTLTLNSTQEISVEEFTLRKTCPLNIICEIKKKSEQRFVSEEAHCSVEKSRRLK